MKRSKSDSPQPQSRLQRASSPKLGDWVLERKLGQGGFGTVYLAYRLGQKPGVKERAAIKVINGHLREQDDYPGHVARFLAEFKVLQKLESPFCAKVLDGDVTAANPWMATQFVSGDSLAEEIRHEGALPVDLWWYLAADLLTGITESHSKGIIHRDIKPQNVMRGVRGFVLIDFGISKLVGNPRVTVDGAPMTPSYASPEQLMGKELTTASDLYSLGHTLLFAAAGRLGFPADNLQSLVAGILGGSPNLDGLDAGVSRFISKLMTLEPTSRPTAQQALAICKEVLGRSSSSSVDPGPGSKEPTQKRAVRKGIRNVRVFRPREPVTQAPSLRTTPQKINARILPRTDKSTASSASWGDFERAAVNFLVRAGRSQFLLPIASGNRRDIYFQGFYDSDGRLTLEAASNQFLDVKLSKKQIENMLELGWEVPSEALPNFIKFLDLDGSKKPRVAKLMADSLKLAYEVAPNELSIDLS